MTRKDADTARRLGPRPGEPDEIAADEYGNPYAVRRLTHAQVAEWLREHGYTVAPRASQAAQSPQEPGDDAGDGRDGHGAAGGDTALRVIAQALGTERWGTTDEFAEHRKHSYYGRCGVCRGDIDAIAKTAEAALKQVFWMLGPVDESEDQW